MLTTPGDRGQSPPSGGRRPAFSLTPAAAAVQASRGRLGRARGRRSNPRGWKLEERPQGSPGCGQRNRQTRGARSGPAGRAAVAGAAAVGDQRLPPDTPRGAARIRSPSLSPAGASTRPGAAPSLSLVPEQEGKGEKPSRGARPRWGVEWRGRAPGLQGGAETPDPRPRDPGRRAGAAGALPARLRLEAAGGPCGRRPRPCPCGSGCGWRQSIPAVRCPAPGPGWWARLGLRGAASGRGPGLRSGSERASRVSAGPEPASGFQGATWCGDPKAPLTLAASDIRAPKAGTAVGRRPGPLPRLQASAACGSLRVTAPGLADAAHFLMSVRAACRLPAKKPGAFCWDPTESRHQFEKVDTLTMQSPSVHEHAVLISKRTFPCENRGNLLQMESGSPEEALSRTPWPLQPASSPGRRRSMEQNREPRNGPSTLRSTNLRQNRKECPMGKRQSLNK
ncbi:translation initiation factor IF-2-like [Lutra lutra]|uniref:translation initiation factor IF-2-like n=1 Tax=Lutra lutra TaxID=9657 RepID=UPI001FD3C32B|nr:translation initiation factor IF-2-like [Lutra lutra]